jgi:hypothetical protein
MINSRMKSYISIPVVIDGQIIYKKILISNIPTNISDIEKNVNIDYLCNQLDNTEIKK